MPKDELHLVECALGHPHFSDRRQRRWEGLPACPGSGRNIVQEPKRAPSGPGGVGQAYARGGVDRIPMVAMSMPPPPPPPGGRPGAQFRELATAITLLSEGIKDLAAAFRALTAAIEKEELDE